MNTRRRLSRVLKCTLCGINLHTIFVTICSIGFLIQFVLILINYFTYPVLTNVYLIVPEVTPLPDVVICFDAAYLINWTRVFNQYPEFKSPLKLPQSLDMKDEVAIRRHIFQMTDKNGLIRLLGRNLTVLQVGDLAFNKSEVIDSYSLTNLTYLQSQEYCELKTVIRGGRYCFIWACSVKKKITISNLDNAKSSISPNILTIKINQLIFDYAPNFFITLVPGNVMPRGNLLRWDTMSVYYKEPRFYKMHYFIFERTLLPAPYETDCLYYPTIGFSQSIDMRDSCFNNKSQKLFGVPFHASTIDTRSDVPLGIVKYYDNRFNQTFRQELNKMVDTCYQLTQKPDCYRKTFYVRPRNPIPTTGNLSVIGFGSIKEPNIHVILEPRLVWIEVIIMIGSISGTWFGFSIAEHVPLIYRSSWTTVSSWVRTQAKENKTEKKVVRELQRRASKALPSSTENYRSSSTINRLGNYNYPRIGRSYGMRNGPSSFTRQKY